MDAQLPTKMRFAPGFASNAADHQAFLWAKTPLSFPPLLAAVPEARQARPGGGAFSVLAPEVCPWLSDPLINLLGQYKTFKIA